jgi:hypothetical protein
VKDIEKDLIENAPSKGSQTDMDTQKSNKAQNATFETIEPEKDNPVRKEFEIGQIGNEELQEDELQEMKQLIHHRAILILPSENFNAFRFDT